MKGETAVENFRDVVRKISEWVVFSVYILLLIGGIMVSAARSIEYGTEILMAIGFGYACLKIGKHWNIDNLIKVKWPWILFLTGMAIKVFIVITIRPEMVVDAYAIFNFCGEILANGHLMENARYVALFPHLLGYISFLLPFFKAISYAAYVATALNACLSAISTLIIYFIVVEIFDWRAAIFSSVLWILWPSQGLWNCLTLSEAFFTTLMLESVFLWIKGIKGLENKKINVSYWIGTGVLLAFFNAARPFAAIFFIGFLLTIVFIYISENNKKWFVALGIALLSFLVILQLYKKYEEHMLREEPAGFSWYNVAVGSNEQYGGKWNQEDWDLLSKYANEPEVTAGMAQKKMIPVVKDHIIHIKHPVNFLIEKIWNFMGCDDQVIGWLKNGGIVFSESQTEIWRAVLNVFFYLIAIITLPAAVIIHRNHLKMGYFLMVCYIGLFLAYMLVEVQGRYHYPLGVLQILIAGGGVYKAYGR